MFRKSVSCAKSISFDDDDVQEENARAVHELAVNGRTLRCIEDIRYNIECVKDVDSPIASRRRCAFILFDLCVSLSNVPQFRNDDTFKEIFELGDVLSDKSDVEFCLCISATLLLLSMGDEGQFCSSLNIKTSFFATILSQLFNPALTDRFTQLAGVKSNYPENGDASRSGVRRIHSKRKMVGAVGGSSQSPQKVNGKTCDTESPISSVQTSFCDSNVNACPIIVRMLEVWPELTKFLFGTNCDLFLFYSTFQLFFVNRIMASLISTNITRDTTTAAGNAEANGGKEVSPTYSPACSSVKSTSATHSTHSNANATATACSATSADPNDLLLLQKYQTTALECGFLRHLAGQICKDLRLANELFETQKNSSHTGSLKSHQRLHVRIWIALGIVEAACYRNIDVQSFLCETVGVDTAGVATVAQPTGTSFHLPTALVVHLEALVKGPLDVALQEQISHQHCQQPFSTSKEASSVSSSTRLLEDLMQFHPVNGELSIEVPDLWICALRCLVNLTHSTCPTFTHPGTVEQFGSDCGGTGMYNKKHHNTPLFWVAGLLEVCLRWRRQLCQRYQQRSDHVLDTSFCFRRSSALAPNNTNVADEIVFHSTLFLLIVVGHVSLKENMQEITTVCLTEESATYPIEQTLIDVLGSLLVLETTELVLDFEATSIATTNVDEAPTVLSKKSAAAKMRTHNMVNVVDMQGSDGDGELYANHTEESLTPNNDQGVVSSPIAQGAAESKDNGNCIPIAELILSGHTSLALSHLVPMQYSSTSDSLQDYVSQKPKADLASHIVKADSVKVNSVLNMFPHSGSWWLPIRVLKAFIALQAKTGILLQDSMAPLLDAVRRLEVNDYGAAPPEGTPMNGILVNAEPGSEPTVLDISPLRSYTNVAETYGAGDKHTVRRKLHRQRCRRSSLGISQSCNDENADSVANDSDPFAFDASPTAGLLADTIAIRTCKNKAESPLSGARPGSLSVGTYAGVGDSVEFSQASTPPAHINCTPDSIRKRRKSTVASASIWAATSQRRVQSQEGMDDICTAPVNALSCSRDSAIGGNCSVSSKWVWNGSDFEWTKE